MHPSCKLPPTEALLLPIPLQIISETIAEALVLIVCDVSNILLLLPPLPQFPSCDSTSKELQDSPCLSWKLSSALSNATLESSFGDASSLPPSEALVTLLTLLGDVDPLANIQVCRIFLMTS